VNSVEDRLHAAISAAADLADREIQAAPPLRLPPVPAPGARRRRLTPRGWIRWGAPLTAAAAVVTLAIALVLVKDIPNGSMVPPNPTPSSSPATSATPGGVPRYYVAVTRQGGLIEGDSVTGQTLARIAPPPGLNFYSVTAAADDRTFAVVALKTVGTRTTMTFTGSWYLVRLDPAKADPPVLAPLPVKPQTAHGYGAFAAFASALSRSGRELAVTEATASGGLAVQVFSVATGQLLHDWTTNDPSLSQSTSHTQGLSGSPSLTWLDGDQVLALNTRSAGPVSTSKNPFLGFGAKDIVRELNVAGPASGDLLADSTVAWDVQTWEYPVTALQSCAGQRGGEQLISADGTTLGCAAVTGRGTDPNMSFLRYPLTTGTAVAARGTVDYQVTHMAKKGVSTQHALWITPSGDALIGAWTTYASGTLTDAANGLHVGVMSHGKFTPLRFPLGFDQQVTLGATTIAW